MDVAARMEPELRAVAETEDTVRLKELGEQGMDVSAPGDAFATALEDAAKKQWDAFAENGGPDARPVLDAYLAERK
jgi:TRAP-type C4-dicarboxylate transport system substrate-binding protein